MKSLNGFEIWVGKTKLQSQHRPQQSVLPLAGQGAVPHTEHCGFLLMHHMGNGCTAASPETCLRATSYQGTIFLSIKEINRKCIRSFFFFVLRQKTLMWWYSTVGVTAWCCSSQSMCQRDASAACQSCSVHPHGHREQKHLGLWLWIKECCTGSSLLGKTWLE